MGFDHHSRNKLKKQHTKEGLAVVLLLFGTLVLFDVAFDGTQRVEELRRISALALEVPAAPHTRPRAVRAAIQTRQPKKASCVGAVVMTRQQ